MRPLVVLGFLGSTLDRPHGAHRWDRWRPTVDLCRHDDLVIARLELLSDRRFTRLARQVGEDIRRVSPETEVRTHDLGLRDPWDSRKSTRCSTTSRAAIPSHRTTRTTWCT
jgi:transcriptional regulatory protein RtcR